MFVDVRRDVDDPARGNLGTTLGAPMETETVGRLRFDPPLKHGWLKLVILGVRMSPAE